MNDYEKALMFSLTFMSYALMDKHNPVNENRLNNKPTETEEEKWLRLQVAERERNKRNGLKMFYYGDNHVWALNKKNADKKAKKKGYL
jgi:hypothetical protein